MSVEDRLGQALHKAYQSLMQTTAERDEAMALLRESQRLTGEATQQALDKAAWTKGWKRKDEYLAEPIARLTREAGTGIDEGRQLSIPETEDTVAPTAEAAE